MYKENPMASVISGLASGVPGDLRGLEYLHNKYGVSVPHVTGGCMIDIQRPYRGEQFAILQFMLPDTDFLVSSSSDE